LNLVQSGGSTPPVVLDLNVTPSSDAYIVASLGPVLDVHARGPPRGFIA
jgi:hypothetical protein